MAFARTGDLNDAIFRDHAGDVAAAPLAQSRYSRRGIAIAGCFAAAIFALAAGGQAMGPVISLGAICALSPARIKAILREAAGAPLITALFALVWLWLVASAFWSPQSNPKTALAVAFYLPAFAVFVWCCRGETNADRELILRAGTACVFLLSLWSLQEGALGFHFLRVSRAAGDLGLFEAQRSLSITLCGLTVLLWPVVALMDSKGGKWKWLLVFPVLAAAIVSRFTHTSAILLALAAGGFCYLAARAYPRAMIVAMGMIVVLGVLAAPQLTDLLKLLPQSIEAILPTSYAARVEIWKNTADLIALKPWFGWGLDASKLLDDPNVYGPLGVSLNAHHPHNAALHIWLETGLVGAGLISALILTLTLSLVCSLGRDRIASAGAASAFAAFLVFACVSFGVWQAWFLATGFAAAGLLAVLLARASSEQSTAV